MEIKIMQNENGLLSLVNELTRIENERKLLTEEQKDVLDRYSNQFDIKAVKAALRIAKIRSKLGDSETQLDDMLETILSKTTI
jgi:uncharacterized protein (UPF0335 family)